MAMPPEMPDQVQHYAALNLGDILEEHGYEAENEPDDLEPFAARTRERAGGLAALAETEAGLEELSAVRWVGVYQPAFRMAPESLARFQAEPEEVPPEIVPREGLQPTPWAPQPVAAPAEEPLRLTVLVFRGADLEATRRSCERFATRPTSIMNFVEGTRFTPAKHTGQDSPYTHLLRPRAGGAGWPIPPNLPTPT